MATNQHSAAEAPRLEARFERADDGRTLRVDYAVANPSDQTMLVFDRGDTHAVVTGRQQAGAIVLPLVSESGGDVTLLHQGVPQSQAGVTLPAIPLVLQVEAGKGYEGSFVLPLPRLAAGAGRYERVRYCLGLALLDEPLPDYAHFEGGVWQVRPDLLDAQQVTCTPWTSLPPARPATP